jgi:hypothetical protein
VARIEGASSGEENSDPYIRGVDEGLRGEDGEEHQVVVRRAKCWEEMGPPVRKAEKAPERLPWAESALKQEMVRREHRRLLPELLPEPSLAVLLAGAVWVNFAMPFASPVRSLCLTSPTMASHH